MIVRRPIFKDFAATGAFSELLALHGAVRENIFSTLSGNVMAVLKVQGIDGECLDAEQTDRICRAFEAALRGLNEDFRVYQHLIKSCRGPLPSEAYNHNPLVQEAIKNRNEYLAAKADQLFQIETYITIVYEGGQARPAQSRLLDFLAKPLQGSRELLSEVAQMDAIQTRFDRACQTLSTKVESLIVQLSDTLRTDWLGKQAAFTFFRSLLNYAPEKVAGVRLKYDEHIAYQACGSSLECFRDHLVIDDYQVKVLSLKEPPARTFAHLLKDLLRVPAEFVVACEWQRVNNQEMRRLVQSMRRHHHNAKTSLGSYLNSSPSGSHDPLVDEGSTSIVRELGSCLEEIEVGGNHFGQYSMTVTCRAKNTGSLERGVAECHRVLAAHDGQFIDERFNLLNAFIAAVPGNDAHNLRRLWLSSRNFADLSFLFAPNPGELRNAHLGAEYLASFETRDGTPYLFNLHVADVGHTLVLGSTGSGKSFLLNFLLTHLQKYQPLCFVFDIGGSYEQLTKLMGGAYVPVSLEKRTFRINPLSLEPAPENLRFLASFVQVLLESNGVPLSSAEIKDVSAQIENLYHVAPVERRLRTLRNVLGRRLRIELERWTEGGIYGELFDNAEDNLSLADFQAFDFEGMNKAPQALEALLFYVFHRANASIYDPASLTRLKVFVMDEAWRFFRHPTIKAYIVEALKTWRKKNAAMIVATQSSADLLQSEMLAVVVESCATKLFLANPGMDQAAYRDVFHLNATEAGLIAGLVPKQEILIKRPDTAKVVTLNVDNKGYWLYTSNPFHHQKRQAAIEQHGFHRALEVLAQEKP